MKTLFFATNSAVTSKLHQFDSPENGALSLACQRAAPYAAAARAASTRDVYARAFQRWAHWCEAMHLKPLAATSEAIAAYLADLAAEGKSVASIKGVLAAILYMHRVQGAGSMCNRPRSPL
jgi:hypothetical protein